MSFKPIDLSSLNDTNKPTVICGRNSIVFNVTACNMLGLCDKVLVYYDSDSNEVAFRKAKPGTEEYKYATNFYKGIKDGAKVRVVRWTGNEKINTFRKIFRFMYKEKSAKFFGSWDEKNKQLVFNIDNSIIVKAYSNIGGK